MGLPRKSGGRTRRFFDGILFVAEPLFGQMMLRRFSVFVTRYADVTFSCQRAGQRPDPLARFGNFRTIQATAIWRYAAAARACSS
jgi:hypothetical protein